MEWAAAIGLIIYAIVSAGFGWHVATVKGRPGNEGVAFGLVFGPLGVLIVALLPTVDVLKYPVANAAVTPPSARRLEEKVNPQTWNN